MAVREFVGMRCVPIIGRIGEESFIWDGGQYEHLTIVMTEGGQTYMSRCTVPAGTPITDTTYWAKFAEFNAQFALLQQTVETYNGRITENTNLNETQRQQLAALTDSVLKQLIDANSAKLEGTTDSGLKRLIDTNTAKLEGTTDSGLKQLIEENTTDISDINGDITEINSSIQGINTNVTNLSATVNSNTSRIQALETGKNYIACIGDSFGNDNSEWPNLLHNRLGVNIINKCTNGAGYTTGTKTFVQQMAELASDPNIDKVSHIIVYGGVNDWSDASASAATMNNAFAQLMNAYNTISGDKPKLIIAFTNIGKPNRSVYNGFGTWYNDCMRWLRVTAKQGIVVGAVYWLWGINDAYLTDNLHPSDRGSQVIASYMMQILNGTYSGCHFEVRNASPTTGTGHVDLVFNDGLFNVSANLANVTLGTGWTEIADFSSYGFGFGSTDEVGGHNELQTNVVEVTNSGEYKIFGFNVRLGKLFVTYRGTTTKPGTAGNSVAGNIACMVV